MVRGIIVASRYRRKVNGAIYRNVASGTKHESTRSFSDSRPLILGFNLNSPRIAKEYEGRNNESVNNGQTHYFLDVLSNDDVAHFRLATEFMRLLDEMTHRSRAT